MDRITDRVRKLNISTYKRYNMLENNEKTRILFVCLGNICRSSSAEGVMKHLIEQAGRENDFVIDSAGILSYHQGELPDSRMRAHAARRGYELTHRSRPVRTEDLLDLMAQTMAGKLRAVFGNRVLGPDKPPVARVQTLFIRKIIVKIEMNAPMARARELLLRVQREMLSEDRFKSLLVYYDVDPM